MTLLWTLLAFFLSLILFSEGAMWLMYRRRTSALRFPREADGSQIRIFTYGRMRYIILIHTVFMITVCTFTLLWLW